MSAGAMAEVRPELSDDLAQETHRAGLRQRPRSVSLSALDKFQQTLLPPLIVEALHEEDVRKEGGEVPGQTERESLRTALVMPGLRYQDPVKEKSYCMDLQAGNPVNHVAAVIIWMVLYSFIVAEFSSIHKAFSGHLYCDILYIISVIGLILAGRKHTPSYSGDAWSVLSFSLGMGVVMVLLSSYAREVRWLERLSSTASRDSYTLDRRIADTALLVAVLGQTLCASSLRLRFVVLFINSMTMIAEYLALMLFLQFKTSRVITSIRMIQILTSIALVLLSSLVVLTHRFKMELVGRQLYFLLTTGPNAKYPEYRESQFRFSQVVEMIVRALPSMESLSVIPSARNAQRLLEQSLAILASRGETVSAAPSEGEYSLIDLMLGKNVLKEVLDRDLTFNNDFEEFSSISASSISPSVPVSEDGAEVATSKEPLIKSPKRTPAWLTIPRAGPTRATSALSPTKISESYWDPTKPPITEGNSDMIYCRYAMFEWINNTPVPSTVSADDAQQLAAEEVEYNVDNWELEPILDVDNCATSFDPITFVGLSHFTLAKRRGFLKCRLATLRSFLWCLSKLYMNNPYHNRFHAAQVGHEAIWLAGQIIRPKLTDAERTYLLIAGLAHDLGHPARTNGYLCAVGNALATVYNDQSVLEHYHCAMLFSVLEAPKFNLLAELSRKDFFSFRQLCIRCILATDMSKHFDILSKARIQLGATGPGTQEDTKGLLFELIIKAADLGHTAISWKYHRVWSDRVAKEFYLQGDDEAKRGLPISPLCDRNNSSIAERAKSQSGFIGHVVMPLFEQLGALDATGNIGRYCQVMLENNKTNWDIVKQTGMFPN